MHKVNILLTEANGNLSDYREIIIDAVKNAEEDAFADKYAEFKIAL